MENKNLCKTCTRCLNGRCNYLVIQGGFGRNDRVARDFIKNGKCDYYKEGEPEKRQTYNGITSFYNS